MQTYIFKDLPQSVISSKGENSEKYINCVEDELVYETGLRLETHWSVEPTYRKDLILNIIDLPEEMTEDVNSLMYNLFGAIPL
jgi:hypothetical protein